ncbi:DUF4158 domain-containing protein [Nonomuraea sp. NPDC050680]|uniref:DUF4158 domain-containing protein n=1 Tax=Nonomuraea sp. NPDC050680 TaxID=3154630 RepID=UPI0033F37F2E
MAGSWRTRRRKNWRGSSSWAAALKEARDKRRLHNRLGWAIQWGTVRMLGTFLTDSGPADVPPGLLAFFR